ncbi:hypothetical protein TW80_08970 [Loktanella sp. S4079]|nr:hypothetical protein TW80_08970 [Loktanella sp. S4079]
MLWTVVICDLVYKLQTLRDLHGDKKAKKLLEDVEVKRAANPTSPDWEVYLLDEVSKRTALLETGEHTQLQNLQKLRHLSAHPVLSGADLLFQPTKEMVRANIRLALESLLLKPPMFSKRIVEALVSDIASNKAILISGAKLKSYLEARYFPNMRPEIELELFKALWKFCFKLRNTDTDTHRDINLVALNVVFERNSATLRAAIDGDQPYFSDVGPDDDLLSALVNFLTDQPSLFQSLNNAAQVLIEGHIDGDINLKVSASFLHADFPSQLKALSAEDGGTFQKLKEKNWRGFLEVAEHEGHLQEACGLAIEHYGSSGSFDNADKRFGRLVAPILEHLDSTRLEELLGAIEDNSQTYDRRRAKTDHSEVKERANALGVDTSPYKNFEATL